MKHFKRWLEEQAPRNNSGMSDAEIDAQIKKDMAVKPGPGAKSDPTPQLTIGGKPNSDTTKAGVSGAPDKPGPSGPSDGKDDGNAVDKSIDSKGDRLSRKPAKPSTAPTLPPVIDIPSRPEPKMAKDPPRSTSGDAGNNPYRDSGGGFGTTGDRPTGGSPGPGGSTTGSGPGKGGTGTGTGDASKPYSSVDWSKVREYGPNTGRSR